MTRRPDSDVYTCRGGGYIASGPVGEDKAPIPWRPDGASLRDAEAVFDRYDGRPHWGKHHTKTAGEFAELYPEWDEFHDVRQELDPDGLFLNDHLQDVFGESDFGP
ncbi:D-arabinono-1,4-lactone oxidase [Natronomonas sp.]|uniref:D-arabinono-1,4-lactone oxidase n=1 Tax=Natronomonas sp. TaxID=2184060 RepID=UPI002FC3960B